MFCTNLFQPSSNAVGANIPKLKQTNKKTAGAPSRCGAQLREALEGKSAGKTRRQDSCMSPTH